MRLNAVLASALFSSATLLGHVRADDSDSILESSNTPNAESSSTSLAAKPTFTVCIMTIRTFVSVNVGDRVTDSVSAAFRYQSTVL